MFPLKCLLIIYITVPTTVFFGGLVYIYIVMTATANNTVLESPIRPVLVPPPTSQGTRSTEETDATSGGAGKCPNLLHCPCQLEWRYQHWIVHDSAWHLILAVIDVIDLNLLNSERLFPFIHFPTSPFQQLGTGQNCCLHYQTRRTYVIGSSILELVEGKCYRKPLHLRLNICTCPIQFLQSVIDYYIPYHPIIPSLWLGLFIKCS